MSDLVSFALPGARSIIVETNELVDDGLTPVGRDSEGVVQAAVGFTDRLSTVREAVAHALAELRDSLGPDEIKVSFGVTFTAETGAVIAKTAMSGNLAVEMTWKQSIEA